MNKFDRFKIMVFPNPSGQQIWRVQGRKIDGQRVRENFKIQAEAKARKAELEIEALNLSSGVGFRQTRLTDDQLAQAESAFLKLQGKPLVLAVEYFLQHGCTMTADISITEAVTKFLAAKATQRKLRPRTLQDYKSRLKPLADIYGNQSLCSVSRSELETLVFKPGQAADTTNGNRRVLHAFFSWCVAEDYALVNPVAKIATTARDQREPEILTLDEIKLFLRAVMTCKNDMPLAHAILGLFVGLRPEEIARLDWKNVDLEQRLVRIQGDGAKLRQRRVIEIPENAIVWLRRCFGQPLAPSGMRREWDKARRTAGFKGSWSRKGDENLKPWPPDVVRHTAISFHLAHGKDENDTASWAGNSPTTVHTHYKGLVNPRETAMFWSLTPDDVNEKPVPPPVIN